MVSTAKVHSSVAGGIGFLNIFGSKGTSALLLLQDCIIKTVMLLVLTRPCRGADLAALDLNHRSYVPEGVVLKAYHMSKQSRPARHGVEFFCPTIKEDTRLCPVETLRPYEQHAEKFRKGLGMTKSKIFLLLFGRHNPVSSSTIARWWKSCSGFKYKSSHGRHDCRGDIAGSRMVRKRCLSKVVLPN